MLIKDMSQILTREAQQIIYDISTVSDRITVCGMLETDYENVKHDLPKISGTIFPEKVLMVYCSVDDDDSRVQIFYMYDKKYQFSHCAINKKMIAIRT